MKVVNKYKLLVGSKYWGWLQLTLLYTVYGILEFKTKDIINRKTKIRIIAFLTENNAI